MRSLTFPARLGCLSNDFSPKNSTYEGFLLIAAIYVLWKYISGYELACNS